MLMFDWFLFLMVFWMAAADNEGMPLAESRSFGGKVNGISLVGSLHPLDSSEFVVVSKARANYICLLPYAFVPQNEPQVYYSHRLQWWGETKQGIAQCISLAHRQGLKVMVKPQLWVHHGQFTGDLHYDSEGEWKRFETSYTRYVLTLLHIADSLDAEMFCLGNELARFTRARPGYWSWLIDTTRQLFDGQITYAENWDRYDAFPHWDKLDYISTNAYFPLSNAATPSVEELTESWKPHAEKMKAFSHALQKPVLFGEFGYRSMDYAAKEPWNSYVESGPNNEAQKNAYDAFFRTFWNEPWCAGGFNWKWFDPKTPTDVPAEIDYSPQGKPALEVLKEWYGKY